MPDPAIILVSEQHADVLLDEFQSRYARDYDLRSATAAREAEAAAQDVLDGGGTVALFVTDSRLPDVDSIYEAIHHWRTVVPTARRVIAAHWDYFIQDGPGAAGRHGQGQVRRLPADAPRPAGRGVPPRHHRPALRLGLDRRRSPRWSAPRSSRRPTTR